MNAADWSTWWTLRLLAWFAAGVGATRILLQIAAGVEPDTFPLDGFLMFMGGVAVAGLARSSLRQEQATS